MTSRRGDVETWRRRDVTVTSLPALHCSKNCFQKLLVAPHRTCIQNKHHIRNLNTKNYIINIKSHGNESLTRVEYECFRHSSFIKMSPAAHFDELSLQHRQTSSYIHNDEPFTVLQTDGLLPTTFIDELSLQHRQTSSYCL